MINELHKAQAELTELLTKFRDKYDATHDELVQVVGYALDAIKYPAVPTGTLTPKGEAELKEKEAKDGKKPVSPAPSFFAAHGKPVPTKQEAAQTKKEEKVELATSKTHL